MKTTRYSADREVARKSAAQVEREAALKWAARARACFARARRAGERADVRAEVRWLLRASHYRDEALEHAALVGDGGRLVGALQRELGAP